MKRVLFLNHLKFRCGVQQFGQIVSDAMKLSPNLNVRYFETADAEFVSSIDWSVFDVVVYNYHDQTMKWLNNEITEFIHSKGIKQFCLTGHDHFADFKHCKNIVADPAGVDDETTFYTGRVIPQGEIKPVTNEVVTIGSFGFGFHQKNFHHLVNLVNHSFDKAVMRLHIPANDFADASGGMAEMFLRQAWSIAKPEIKFVASTGFLDRQAMIQWLSENDLNLFVYEDQPGRGISSAIDFALAARKPIGISKSCMFRHIWDDPRILVSESPLSDIIKNGVEPLEKYYEAWSLESASKRYEEILSK